MPFYLSKSKKLKPLNKKAITAATPKSIFAYNSLLCYLRGLCRKVLCKFSRRQSTAVKGSVGEEKTQTNILAQVNGGSADDNTRFQETKQKIYFDIINELAEIGTPLIVTQNYYANDTDRSYIEKYMKERGCENYFISDGVTFGLE
ncbi:MAG TPA: hypothetical protein PK431_11640 [Chitinophagales bacterium]|nr:hypothetical protein [Chitinophagales bacterium]